MIQAKASTVIARPVESVFDFVAADFFINYPRWSPEVVSLQPLSPGPVKVGTRARQVRVDQGRRTEAEFQVCALERPLRLDFRGTTDAFRISYQFETLSNRTRLTFAFELQRLDLHMRPFRKLIRIAVQDGAERVVRNIKGLVETEMAATHPI